MTQTRPRLDDGLAADVREFASAYGISFNAAVKMLIRLGLLYGRLQNLVPVKGDGSNEDDS
jgi:hypothetical protein